MFWNNFVKLCNERGLKPNPVAKELGLSSGSVTAWKNGVVPRDTALQKIAAYFGISVAELIEEKKPADEGEPLNETMIIYHRDGKSVKREFTKDQMEMLIKMIEAIPEKPKDI